ncbi:hypothetical protein XELAEV_18018282mg [Xenopus laevis]|uniref:Uncharacterized protein n=1 Tax=Xenopus laevis TaxID=8355 RepID=A0A974DCN8_XENLA|nr:hypothetical protein XELAEV_18018282mg [Xenopus laevis]
MLINNLNQHLIRNKGKAQYLIKYIYLYNILYIFPQHLIGYILALTTSSPSKVFFCIFKGQNPYSMQFRYGTIPYYFPDTFLLLKCQGIVDKFCSKYSRNC